MSISTSTFSFILFIIALNGTDSNSFDAIAAPIATNTWEFSGTIKLFSSSPKVSLKRSANSDKKCSGPPSKAMLPRIGLPHAKLDIVWLTTDWNTETAISSLEAPWFINACISVFAKTPHLEAIGKTFL